MSNTYEPSNEKMVIYGLYLDTDDRVRYVGMTTSTLRSRFNAHLRQADRVRRNISKVAYAVHYWILKHGSESVRVRVLDRGTSAEELQVLEQYWITELDTHTTVGGLNMTWGGEWGNCWDAYTDEQKFRAREHMRHIQAMQTATPEARAKRSQLSKETMARLQEDDDFVMKAAQTFKNLWADPEWRITASQRASDWMTHLHHEDSEFQARHIQRLKDRWNDPVFREMMTQASRDRWKDDEYRESTSQKISDSKKRSWMAMSEEKKTEFSEKIRAAQVRRHQALKLEPDCKKQLQKPSHKRWHIDRGVTSPTCLWCVSEQ